MQAAMRIAIAAAQAAGRRAIRGAVPPAQQQGTSGAGEVHAAGAPQRVSSRPTDIGSSSRAGGRCAAAEQSAGASESGRDRTLRLGSCSNAGADKAAAAARLTGKTPQPGTSQGSAVATSAGEAMPAARAAVAAAAEATSSSGGASSGGVLRSSSRQAAEASPAAAADVAGMDPVSPPAPLWRQHGHVSSAIYLRRFASCRLVLSCPSVALTGSAWLDSPACEGTLHDPDIRFIPCVQALLPSPPPATIAAAAGA
jgi:hypothetical protein